MLDGSVALWFYETPDVLAIPLGAGRTSLQIDEDLVFNGPHEALAGLADAINKALGRGDDREREAALDQDEALAAAEDAHVSALESRF